MAAGGLRIDKQAELTDEYFSIPIPWTDDSQIDFTLSTIKSQQQT